MKSFLKRLTTRAALLTLILMLLSVASAVASGARVWGMDPDVLRADLGEGNHEFLRHLSVEHRSLREIDRLGEDAGYALGLIYLDLGLPSVAIDLFEHAWRTAPEPYGTAALEQLLVLLESSGSQERRRSVALELSAEEALWKQSVLTRLHYESQEYFQVLSRARSQLERARLELPPADPLRQELELWMAVSSAMEERESGRWQSHIRAIYRDYPATEIHSRLYLFVLFHAELRAQFDESELRFFRAKQLLAEGAFRESAETFRGLAAGPQVSGRAFVLHPYGVFDFFRAATAAEDTVSARSLELLASELGGLRASRALEYSGRVLRTSGAPTAAIRPLERALALLPAGESDQRIRWYLWNARVRSDAVAAAAAVGEAVATFADPAYFSDLFGELADRLIADAAWTALLTAYRGIEQFAEPSVLARYQLMLALLSERGMLAVAAGEVEGLRTGLLERAASQSGDRFSAIVSATLLGADAVSTLTLSEEPDSGAGALSESELLAATYFRYGLFDRLEQQLRRTGGTVPPVRLETYARRLQELGEFPRGIVATNWIRAADGELTRQRAALRYPRAYAGIIDTVTIDEGIDPWTYYALVREESLFQPAVASVVGAQGLAQLMPATAADVARRMRMDSFDLSDPADNLGIGARYFSMLSDQFRSPARAIAAYNGGQGNVRRWERQWDTNDELFFHQRIPFAETFDHVRKVVVSAAYYGYLYAERSPAETVKRLFALPQE